MCNSVPAVVRGICFDGCLFLDISCDDPFHKGCQLLRPKRIEEIGIFITVQNFAGKGTVRSQDNGSHLACFGHRVAEGFDIGRENKGAFGIFFDHFTVRKPPYAAHITLAVLFRKGKSNIAMNILFI